MVSVRRGPPPPPPPAVPTQQRLAAEADRAGNADGLASPAELAALHKTLEAHHPTTFDLTHTDRMEQARGLAAGGASVATLDPELRAMPAPLRRLALELDAHWGNADGKISPAELDRVARYYLAALPFFTSDAGTLLELARHLKLDVGEAAPVRGVVNLRIALSKVDKAEVEAARPFREIFDDAVRASEAPGAPDLLRDWLQHSPKWHSLSILEHSAVACSAARALSDEAGIDWKDAGATMLLHDVGKILERQVRKDGQPGHDAFSFWDHEADGARWLKDKGVSEELIFQVNHHSDLRQLSVDDMVALAGTPDRLARMVVVYVADQVAKGVREPQLRSFQKETPKILELARRAGLDGAALLKRADALRAEHFSADARALTETARQ